MTDYLVDVSPNGKKRVSNMVFFIMLSPDERPLYFTMRRKMKDAVMTLEDKYDSDWEELEKAGFIVLKCWANGVDFSWKVSGNINDWVQEEPHIPHYVKLLKEKSS